MQWVLKSSQILLHRCSIDTHLRIMSNSSGYMVFLQHRRITLFCLLWNCLQRLNSMSQAWTERRLYSRLHQLSSQSYNRAQREKKTLDVSNACHLNWRPDRIHYDKNRTFQDWGFFLSCEWGKGALGWHGRSACHRVPTYEQAYGPRQGCDLQPVKNGKWIFYWKPAACDWSQQWQAARPNF